MDFDKLNKIVRHHYKAIISFLVILVVVLVAISLGTTQHYDDGEISFNYPQNWKTMPVSNPSEVIAFSDPGSGLNVTVYKVVMPSGYNPPQNYIFNSAEFSTSGFKLVSNQVFDLNGREAYENVYQINSGNSSILRKEVWIANNRTLYTMIYTFKTSSSNSSGENIFNLKSGLDQSITSSEYEGLVKSFRVNSPPKPPNTPFWGDVDIPSLGVKWGIRSDTVNGYGSVYHYNESYYAGQNGTFGLLGHRTIYSAPFNKIDQLKPGDEVVIDDYLSQKKYTYQVTSNGEDIRYDYQTNPITFPGGDANLFLVTCYPPGTTDAAWIVHCKLKSVEPL